VIFVLLLRNTQAEAYATTTEFTFLIRNKSTGNFARNLLGELPRLEGQA